MKKLIALLICVGLATLAAHAQTALNKTQKALNAQVEKARRVVELTLTTANMPIQQAIGRAVIVKSTGTEMVLLTTQSFAMNIDDLGDEPSFAVVKQGQITVPAMVDKQQSYNPGVNQHFYVVTLTKLKAKAAAAKLTQLPPVTLPAAVKLLK